MVHDVGVDDAMEDVSANETEITIDGGQGARNERPALGVVVRDLLVGVMEVGDGN